MKKRQLMRYSEFTRIEVRGGLIIALLSLSAALLHRLLVPDADVVPLFLLYPAVGIGAWLYGVTSSMSATASNRLRYEALAENANLIPWEADARTGMVSYIGPQTLDILGYPVKDWHVPGFWATTVYPGDRAWVTRARADKSACHDRFELEYRMLTAQGRILWVRDLITVQRDADGPTFLQGYLINISGLKEAQIQLEREKESAQVTLQSIGDGVITTDALGRIQQMNPVAVQLTGWPEDKARGRLAGEVFRILDEDSRKPAECPVARALRDKVAVEEGGHALLISRDGRERVVEDSASPVRLASGPVIGTVLVFRDVTEQRRLLNAMMHQATHDPLTGLVNRREFEERLKRAIEHSSRHCTEHALLYMDLDQFKVVNDTCGHSAGDELLRQLAHVLLGHVRDRDTLARLGGDEFALLMEHCTSDDALLIAEKLLGVVRGFRFSYEDQIFQVGLSIGLVPINDTSHKLEHIMGLADHACYIAKESGRNRVYVQREDMQDITQRQQEMSWIARLNDAIHNDRLTLYYQKIQPLSDAAEKGGHWEILLRMHGPNGQLLTPGAFIPSAERYDLMPTIDRWVVEHTLTWLASMPKVCAELGLCTINVSARTLADETFLKHVETVLDQTRVPPQKLCFEITETAAIANLQKTLSFMTALRERGCRFALDDFGTGMASFAYLKLLPVDFIKIDGSFVEAIADSAIDLEIVRSINDISHIMGKRTVAEFVSERAIMDKLIAIGVDYVQGYYIARPAPLADAAKSSRYGSLSRVGH